jgi:hypothetical protein
VANNLYNKAREGFVAGEIVWKATGGSVIKASLVRGYTYSVTHKFLSDVIGAGGTIVATETLNSLTNTDGVLDAADAVWETVPEGPPIPHCVIYQASAVTGGADVPASQQRLIVCQDKGSGLPIFPNGQNITGAWSPGADRIARF